MVKINTKKDVIPVEIGDLEFDFRMTDENIKNFEGQATKTEEALVKAVDEYQTHKITESEMIDILNDELTALYDLILEKGAYKKIYKQTPSSLTNIDIFMELIQGIRAEYETLLNEKDTERKEKMDKYKELKKK